MKASEKQDDRELFRYRQLQGPLRWLFITFSFAGILVAIYQLFHLNFLGAIVGDGYYYLLVALYLPLIFLIAPARKNRVCDEVPWYDMILALICFIAPMYLFLNAYQIIQEAWEIVPPVQVFILGLALLILISARTKTPLFTFRGIKF